MTWSHSFRKAYVGKKDKTVRLFSLLEICKYKTGFKMSHTVSVEQQKKLKFCASASVCIRWQEEEGRGRAGVGASRSPTRSFALDAPPCVVLSALCASARATSLLCHQLNDVF